MPKTEYVKCPNSGCGKINPVTFEEGKEYTCMFCGQPFTPAVKAAKAEEVSFKKRDRGKKSLATSEAKPVNRNTRKPVI
jgi:hypothetical protein